MTDKKVTDKFLDLIEENKKLIYKVSHMYCDHDIDKQDIFQEIITNIWEAYPRFKGDSKVSAWIYRIALNTAISWFRQYKKDRRHIQYTGIIPKISESSEADKLNEKLQGMIGLLGKLDRALILLQLDGYSYEEIAAIMGITKTNVATRINRIKQKLKNHLSNT